MISRKNCTSVVANQEVALDGLDLKVGAAGAAAGGREIAAGPLYRHHCSSLVGHHLQEFKTMNTTNDMSRQAIF